MQRRAVWHIARWWVRMAVSRVAKGSDEHTHMHNQIQSATAPMQVCPC